MGHPKGDSYRDLRDRILHLELDVKLLTHLVNHHSNNQPTFQQHQQFHTEVPQTYQQVSPVEPTVTKKPSTPVVQEEPEEQSEEGVEETEAEEVVEVTEEKPKQTKAPEPEVVEGENFKDTILKSLAKNLSTSIGMVVLASGTVITGWIQGASYKPQEVPKESQSQQQTNNPTQR